MAIETLENFGVPAVLAEDKPILAVEAYKLFVGETATNPSTAGVLSVLLIAASAAVLFLQQRFLAGRRFATAARGAPPPLVVRPLWRRAATLYRWGVVLLALVPFLAIVVLSFMEFRGAVLHAWFSLRNYAELFDGCRTPARQ